jgi:hypothetical protein
LSIDADTELSFAIAAQRLKAIARQKYQVFTVNRNFQDIQPPFCLLLESLKLLHPLTCGESLGSFVTILLKIVWRIRAGHESL